MRIGLISSSNKVSLFVSSAFAASGIIDYSQGFAQVDTMAALIRNDPVLVQLDHELTNSLAAARNALAEHSESESTFTTLDETQKAWWQTLENCVSETEKNKCIKERYEYRLGWLNARYDLAPHGDPFHYTCNGKSAAAFTAIFFQGEPPSVRIEHDGHIDIAVLAISGSGARYINAEGLLFWIKGKDAHVEWKGQTFQCTALQP